MKNAYKLLVLFASVNAVSPAQVFSPVATSGYTLDAIAENTTAAATTAGAIDGSDYVMYSAAYGAIFNSAYGLPNNGLVSAGTRTYQLQTYTAGNVLYVPASQSGTIFITTPAQFGGISLLGFGTEGAGNFDLVLTFTDNTTQTITNQTFPDWFNSGNTVISGFDRCTRTSGTPALSVGNPKMYYLDYSLNCASRSKALASITINNVGTGSPRICILAVSGTGAPSYSATGNPVTCANGINGSASILSSGGLPPFTYTWNTTPVQSGSTAVNLGVGVYSYSVQDNGGCVVTSTVSVTQSLAAQPSLTLSTNASTICSGNSVTLAVTGAQTYTWSGGSNNVVYSPPAQAVTTQTTVTYTVSGLTSVNCLRTGSINITINPLPSASWSANIGSLCKNGPNVLLSNFVQPAGGVFSGLGVSSGSFIPGTVGTFTVTYTRTDASNCSNSATTSVQVFSLAPPSITSPGALCSNAAPLQMTVNPTGGTFSGTGMSSTGMFSPSVAGSGVIPAGYSITSGPCTSSAGINIIVNAAPVVSVSSAKTFFCKNSPSLFLNGTPSGGTFSGPGMNGSAFTPAQASISNSNIIVYSYTDLNGCTDTAAIRLTVSGCVGIDEVKQNSAFSLFPNPSTGKITLTASERVEIQIISELGQTVKNIVLEENNQYQAVTELSAGVYFVRPAGAAVTESKRLVILK